MRLPQLTGASGRVYSPRGAGFGRRLGRDLPAAYRAPLTPSGARLAVRVSAAAVLVSVFACLQLCGQVYGRRAQAVNRIRQSGLWPETLSSPNWSVILSPHEGADHVEQQRADKSEGSDDGHRREVHGRRGLPAAACSSRNAWTARLRPNTRAASSPASALPRHRRCAPGASATPATPQATSSHLAPHQPNLRPRPLPNTCPQRPTPGVPWPWQPTESTVTNSLAS
jgi:hypothetical protein